jgi:hypothetical protein
MMTTTTTENGRIGELVRYFLRLGCLGFGVGVLLVLYTIYGLTRPVFAPWSGFKLFGKINDETFRKTELVLLLFVGLSLIGQALPFTFR